AGPAAAGPATGSLADRFLHGRLLARDFRTRVEEAAVSLVDAALGAPLRVEREARAGRDEPPDDDILLEPPQVVLDAADCRVGQHPRRLLEGGRGYERVGLQRGLRDSEQHRLEL